MKGHIDDCCCDVEKVDDANEKEIASLLDELVVCVCMYVYVNVLGYAHMG